MASPVDGIQDPYLATLELSIYEYLKLYNKTIVGLPENDRYGLYISKWTDFYQSLEDYVSTFGFKAEVMIATDRDGVHIPTAVNNIILFYLSITKSCGPETQEHVWAHQNIMEQNLMIQKSRR